MGTSKITEKQKAQNKAYKKTEAYKSQQREYNARPEIKERRRAYFASYNATPEAKAKRKAFDSRPEQIEKKRDQRFKRKFGISTEDWDALFKQQGRKCAICKALDPKHKYGWATDHCHKTGTVRGILCQNCNLLIGQLGDNSLSIFEFTMNILQYLADAGDCIGKEQAQKLLEAPLAHNPS